ncbi:MAG: biotin synthase BioB [Candidatus Omnitrophota bacterium]
MDNVNETISLIRSMPVRDLVSLGDCFRKKCVGNKIEICGIFNAKSGRCSEDCKFCAQSAHYSSEIREYPLKPKNEIVKAAQIAEKNSANRFGIVTSGRRLLSSEIMVIADAVGEIVEKCDILPCASLGALTLKDFEILKQAGLSRYHHNLETSQRFYSQIVTTHTYDERVNAIINAKKAGLEVCSGGIFGIGESWQDRVDLALLLKKLEVNSVPLNFLVPIKGTPMEKLQNISQEEALRLIVLFRILLKNKTLKVVAGRETIFGKDQHSIYEAGANGMMIGGYLTTPGQLLEQDQLLIEQMRVLWNKE